MTRNLKALGLAFVAVFAMSAVAASAAHATEFFHSHKEKTVLTGTGGPAVTKIGGSEIICKVSHYEGLSEGVKHTEGTLGTTYTTESVTVHPIYTECTLGANAAAVRTHECHYVLYAATTETVAGKPHGNAEIETCPSTAPIEIEVPALGIIISVENQLIPHCVNYTNNKPTGETEKWDVIAKATCPAVIVWKCTKGKAACVTAFGASEGNNASYTDEDTIKGFEYKSGTTGSYEEGPQTGIWKGPTE